MIYIDLCRECSAHHSFYNRRTKWSSARLTVIFVEKNPFLMSSWFMVKTHEKKYIMIVVKDSDYVCGSCGTSLITECHHSHKHSCADRGIIDMNWNGNSANFFSYACNGKKIKELFASTLVRYIEYLLALGVFLLR